MENYYTEDFSLFGSRERHILKDILTDWEDHGLPIGFYASGVKPAFNMASGYVFLTNEDYQVAMFDGDTLTLWHNLPYGGAEGFLEDLMLDHHPDHLNEEDAEYIRNAPEFDALLASGCYPTWEAE